MSEKTGKALAEQKLIESVPIEPPEAQQEFEFLFDGLQIPKNREQRIKLAQEVRKRAVGRPKGSRNKSSLANKEYCQKAGYMSALDIVGSRASMGIAELAAIEGLEMDTAASLWKQVMQQVHADLENKSFAKPSTGLTTVTICADSGLQATEACKHDARTGEGGRIINIHPSLLPAFRGAHAIEQAFEYGVKVFGVTIHYVDAELDGGRIIAQRAFAYEGRDVAELESKIHAVEYPLYVETIGKLLKEKEICEH